ncbi:rod-binding protein [Kamptonema cortianum]|nr:rod-binding protein [Kamptonema cortianum]
MSQFSVTSKAGSQLMSQFRDKVSESTQKPQLSLRSDFKSALEAKLNASMGAKGTDKRRILESAFKGVIKNGEVSLDRLPEKTHLELKKLQKASEDFESFFVKDLLSKMRATSFSEEKSPMSNFATDMMDQAIADAGSKGQGLGIAKKIFITMAESIVKQDAVAKTTNQKI